MNLRPRKVSFLSASLSAPILALSLLGVASCSSGGGGGSSETVPADATVIKAIEGISWDAKTYTAHLVDGQATLSLRDDSSLPHNLHLVDSDDVDQGVALDVKGKGDVHTAKVTLKPGSYQVICTIAGHGNMKATLTVS